MFDRYGINEFITDWYDGVFTSARRLPLSPYQEAHGCREVIKAKTWRELISLAMAERIKADLIEMAERAFTEDHGHPPAPPEVVAAED